MRRAIKLVNQNRAHALNIFWSNLNQGVITASALAISIIFARFAGKELYGQYLLVVAMFGLCSIVSIPGVRTVIFRTTAQGYDGVYLKGTALSLLWSLLGIPLIVITGVFFYLYKTKTVGISLIVCALFLPLVTSLQNWMLFLKGRSEFRRLTIYNSIKLSVTLVAVAAAIVFTGNLIIILLAYFLVNGGFNILYHLKALSSLKNDELDPGWQRQSYALTIMDLSGMVFGQMDIVLVAALLPIGQVAIYGLVMKLANVFLQAIKSTVEVVLPRLYKSEKMTVGYFYRFFVLSFLIPIILYPIVKYLVLSLYGRQYSQVTVFSQVYLAVIPVYFLSSIVTSFMVKYRLNKEINIGRIIAIISVIVLYTLLIPLYGVWGGVVSSMLFFVIQLTTNLVLIKLRKSEISLSVKPL